MCGGNAEWKDSTGTPRYSEQSRDFWNRKHARGNAVTAKMAEFDTAAAGVQTPEFLAGREAAYKTEYGDDFQKEYDDALNAISEGFIRKGIYKQKDYDTQKTALDTNPTGQSRLDALAKAYADKGVMDLSPERSRLFNSVNALKDFEGNLSAINDATFNVTSPQNPEFGYWDSAVWKEETPEFLSGVEKLNQNQAPTPQARSATAPSPSRSARQRTLTNSMGVRTPYSQASQKIVR